MYNPKNYEYDCTRKCRLRAHGNSIASALTKRSIENEKLAAYVAKICCNYADILDDKGRSAVHVAASVNRYEILEWLLNQGAIINGRDFESCSTPLHNAIFYGCIDCAILLLRYGASLDALDGDNRSPLQQVCRIMDYRERGCYRSEYFTISERNELLVWGSNKNYNLGANNDQGSDDLPQMLDYFRKEKISIQEVALGAYHSLFLSRTRNLYAVGHGSGGRLGTGNEDSLSTPKEVKVVFKKKRFEEETEEEEIISVSVSRKHSLVLTNYSMVYACGLNDSQQLGIHNAGESCLRFKEVYELRHYQVQDLLKVIAKDYYSLTYSNNCLFVWGTNMGQMVFDYNIDVVPKPRLMKVPEHAEIQYVGASNSAIVVLTKSCLIFLFHNYKMKTIMAPNYESLKSVVVDEGSISNTEKGSASALKFLLLTETNVVFIWYQLTQKFYRCSFPNIGLTQIDKILYKGNQLMVLSHGDIYKGKTQQVSVLPCYNSSENANTSKSSGNIWIRTDHRTAEIAKDFMIRIELQRIVQIDRALDIFCDDDFVSFAALQESNLKYFETPELSLEVNSFEKLYNNVSEDDALHDIVFWVNGVKFPAHQVIVYALVPGLRPFMDTKQKEVFLDYPLLTPKIFELILKFVYLNYYPNEQDLEDIKCSFHTADAPAELKDVCSRFHSVVKQFNIVQLHRYLQTYLQKTPFCLPQNTMMWRYKSQSVIRNKYRQYYDVRILCENNEEIPAHKCILVARSEYFERMFMHNWAEQNTVNLPTVPSEYVRTMVGFLYNLDAEFFSMNQDSETFLYNMIVYCDQLLYEPLRKVCEIKLLKKITIRKCGDMLDFACMYNCELLKKGCLNFICQNLARVLLQKSLHNCEPETLKCISEHYRKMFKDVFDYRIITPDSEAIDDDCLVSFVEDFQVDLNYRMDEDEKILYRNSQKGKTKENKYKSSTRQHEIDAINSMMVTLNINENSDKVRRMSEKSQTVKEAEEVTNKLQNEAHSWMKVSDKKDNKKKLLLEKTVTANEIINKEETPSPNYVPLTKTPEILKTTNAKTPEKENESDALPSNIADSKLYNINIADLTTTFREKLSQKQRKRLSTESSNNPISSWRASSSQASTPVAKVQSTPNAWGTPPSPATIMGFDATNPPPTGSLEDPSSFANMIRSSTASTSSAATAANANNSFSQILAEEKRQREHYERTKHKSLALTQIEEQAIAELEELYNVQNVTDEIITIQRKSIQPTINFAIWQRH